MSDAETWGIVLRDCASGAEQWVACEVTRDDDDILTARAHGYGYRSAEEYARPAVEGVGRLIRQHDRTLSSVRIATPAEYAAHMEGVRRALVADEVEQLRASIANREEVIGELRAEVKACRERSERFADALFAVGRAVGVEAYESAPIIEAIDSARRAALTAGKARADQLSDTIGAIGRRVCAESCERDVILDAIGDACDAARRGGEVSMRHAAASWCERAGLAELAADIREFALTGSQPAQSHEAPATPSAPLNVADAAARARSAAAQRVANEAAPVAAPDAEAWVETWTDAGPRGLRVIRAALTTAAPERWQAERLVEAAWLSRGRIDMGGDPLSMWHAIIDEAVIAERLDDLVAAARAKYPQCGL